jgi:hypothetical protein
VVVVPTEPVVKPIAPEEMAKTTTVKIGRIDPNQRNQ